jgi:hypothetical protein
MPSTPARRYAPSLRAQPLTDTPPLLQRHRGVNSQPALTTISAVRGTAAATGTVCRVTLEEPNSLPRSRAALAQARRVLDDLARRELSREGYSDQIPYALDRLDNVWRTIDDESEGQRTHEFGAWWKKQRTRTRDSVKVLRNRAVKSGIRMPV